jgi:O-antigen/teichoic acid export membrane protein
MGVIQRQGLKYTIVNLAGLVIGGACTLWLYPLVVGEYGLFQILLAVGVVGLPIIALGANTVAIRFFPYFEDKKSGHHGFLALLLGLCSLGYLLFGTLAFLLWGLVRPTVLSHSSPILGQYIWAAPILACLWVTSAVMSAYSANFKRIVVPSLLLEFSQKIVVPLLLFCVWLQWITLTQAVWGLILHALLVCSGMLFYLKRLGQLHLKPDWLFLTPALRKEIGGFLRFSTLSSFALVIVAKADLFLVGALLPIAKAGVYSIATFLATTLEIPIKGLYTASVSSVTRYIADDDREALSHIYKRVSINLICIGLGLFGAIWISIDSVFAIMQKSEVVATGKWVFFFIGLSRLVEMGTGLNNYMIYYSPHYRLSLLPMGLLAVANITFGIWLIPEYGFTGAAISTLGGITSYNAFSLWLVWRKFGLFPFGSHTVVALAMAIFTFMVVSIIPRIPDFPLLDILLHSGLYTVAIGTLFLGFNVAPDLNDILRQIIKRIPLFRK